MSEQFYIQLDMLNNWIQTHTTQVAGEDDSIGYIDHCLLHVYARIIKVYICGCECNVDYTTKLISNNYICDGFYKKT